MTYALTLDRILDLVGRLDDSPGNDTPRDRFRRYFETNVRSPNQLKDYVTQSLENSGEQYYRAFQDLINHCGLLLGFDVIFGRYQGVQGQVGFDGHWICKTPDYHVIVEAKTSESSGNNTGRLINYIDGLISQGQIPDKNSVLGLYVIGRPNPKMSYLENAIIAEKETHILRVISAEHLIALAQLTNEYHTSRKDVLVMLRPMGPKIDPMIDLAYRLGQRVGPGSAVPEKPQEFVNVRQGELLHWLVR
jgi:hypothetical protein